MRFLIISHVIHSKKMAAYYGYSPYVREMNIWLKFVDTVEVFAPLGKTYPSSIEMTYIHPDLNFTSIPSISIKSLKDVLRTCINLPLTVFRMQRAMRRADHIHLRCPGNMGILGCLVQMFFPSKKKTAKYAGNWDPSAEQPMLYRLQKWILSNKFLTRNMTVLVYGQWPGQTENIKPFFTATYNENDKQKVDKKFDQSFKALFVGTMGSNKRPFETVQIVFALLQKGVKIELDMYGTGPESDKIREYILLNNLEEKITLHGNQPIEVVKEAYKKSHFLILLSQSEGWPKVIAEAMFWGVVPISTPVSCVPWMLDNGNRGILLENWGNKEIISLLREIDNTGHLHQMSVAAQKWSRQYTLDTFENAIEQLL